MIFPRQKYLRIELELFFNVHENQLQNYGINVYDKFGKRDVVIDTCIKGLKSLTLNNPKINAWAGQIKIRVDGKFVPIDCRGCTGSPSLKDGFIVVDGNSDSEKMANTHCLDGDVCSLVWNIKGI